MRKIAIVKISALILILTTVAVIASMTAILVHERERIREIEAESAEIRQVRRDINAAHRHITRLATLGESVIGWKEADSARYRALRLRTDSLLQAFFIYHTSHFAPRLFSTSFIISFTSCPTCTKFLYRIRSRSSLDGKV